MFDISWSELLILGVVTLIFVGPKELPVFLRTIGKYVGMVKRQASEFREQFDGAMREAELDQLRKDMMSMKSDVETSVRSAERSMQSEFDTVKQEFDGARQEIDKPSAETSRLADASPSPGATPTHADAHDADGLPVLPIKSTAAEPVKSGA